MRAPLVLGEKSKQIGGEVADYHEGDIVDDETHDALPKTGIAPVILYHQVSCEAMALKLRPTGLKHHDERQDHTVRCGNMEIGRIYGSRARAQRCAGSGCPFDGRTH
jgi:hypothetical protein